MLVKFGAIVTTGSGSLAGHTIQHSKGGMQLRTKPKPSGSPTASQVSIRSIMPVLQQGWHDLTDAQRRIWNDWPVIHGIYNAHGDKMPLSGHSLWIKYNYTWIAAGGYFLPDPSYWEGPILGPELIPNGDFSSGVGWNLNNNWTVSGGHLNHLALNANRTDVSFSLNSGIPCLLRFKITSAFDVARLYLRNQAQLAIFDVPWTNAQNFAPGSYSFQVLTIQSFTNFRIAALLIGHPYSMDFISLKQII